MENVSLQSVEIIINGLLKDPIAISFMMVIFGWFALAVFFVLTRIKIGSGFVAITPSSLSTLGLLGTFVGILLGLAQFKVHAINESVPILLDGMKIAFSTSVAGIVTSISFKLVSSFSSGLRNEQVNVTPADILNALNSIEKSSKQTGQEMRDSIQELKNTISSDSDTSLITQVQKLRTTFSDGQNDLIKEFREFAAHMVENNQKAIIEALEGVIKDFNEKLTEQFGENFKQLNMAVTQLVEWQDEYKSLLEIYEQRLNAATSSLESTGTALEKVREATDKIPIAVEALDPTIKLLISEVNILQESLEAVKALRQQTDAAFPIIEENLGRLTDGFTTSVSGLMDTSAKALENNQVAYSKLNDGFESLISGVKDNQTSFGKTVVDTAEALSKMATEQFTKHGDLIESSAQQSNKTITEAWANSSEKLNTQFEEFDRQLQQELTRALEQLGRNLATISEKFVSDYTPITENLRKIVNLANGNT